MKPVRLLVCTDLDRTLIPNGAEEESPGARRRFTALAARPEVALAYVTGRDRTLIGEAMTQWALPQPDFVIGDVGTSIWQVDAYGEWRRDTAWDRAIGADWGGRSSLDLAEVLRGLDPLRLQEDEKQGMHKLSYYCPLDADRDALRREIETRFAREEVNARLVWSVDEPRQIGLLDVLPAAASKLHALRSLMERAAYGEDETVFCGDSGNDLEVLVSSVRAVLVANAAAEVRQEAERGSDVPDRLYCARGGFLGMNGCYAAGMLEGIAHFFPGTLAWMGFPEDVA